MLGIQLLGAAQDLGHLLDLTWDEEQHERSTAPLVDDLSLSSTGGQQATDQLFWSHTA
jgi:hypothetical protein